jgi:hypothetical protein
MIFINNTIHNQALAKDTTKAINIGVHRMAVVVVANSSVIKLEAAKMTGIDIRNENRAAASRV